MKTLSQIMVSACIITCLTANAQTSTKTALREAGKIHILNIDAHAFPKISVSFKAEQQNGVPVWGLSEKNIRISEDGKQHLISEVKPSAGSVPVFVSLVVDHSGSMDEDHAQLYDKEGKPRFTIDKDDNMVVPNDYTSPIDNAKSAIKQFTSSFDTQKDFISLTGFGTTVDKPLALTHNENIIIKSISDLEAIGKTALYDGMMTGIEQLKNAYGIKALVVLTDGQDNTSKSTQNDVIEKAVSENIPVYIIGLGDVGKSTLSEICMATNGQFFYTNSSTSLESIYTTISQRVQAIYQVEYVSENTDKTQMTRTILLSSFAKKNVLDEAKYTIRTSDVASLNTSHPGNNIQKSENTANKNLLNVAGLPKVKMLQSSAINNEMDIFWILGNIILAGFIATAILFYKKKKAERNYSI
ncbi:MAG: VWA domain-containing protein [Bacteroidota bacterium]